MKILQITDVLTSAITRLCKQIIKHNKSEHEIKLVSFHPKKPDKHELENIKKLWNWADIVDVQYWKSGAKIAELFPELWNKKKKILTHYNPYNLLEQEWKDYAAVVVVNNYQQSVLPAARLFPLSVDLDYYKFNRSKYTIEPVVNMSVNRMESKKGVIEVALACQQLNYRFLLVGRVSDAKYMNEVKSAGGKILTFKNSASDDEVRQAYYDSAIHVCNSKDLFESGTLPLLECMSCGTPVLTRLVGHVPDLNDGTNMHINDKPKEDVENIKKCLKEMMDDRDYRIKLRINAEKTVQGRSDKIRAEQYNLLYKEIFS